jgi:hypothetical protein
MCGMLAVVPLACGEPPALQIGPVAYSAEELGVLGPSQRRTLADLVAFGLAIAEDRTGQLTESNVRADLRSIVLQRMAMEMALDEAGIDDRALREAYSRAPQQELVVRHLVVISERWRPQEHRDSARAEAREALERARAGEDFETLVAEYSDEPRAAERGGLLQAGRQGTWVPEFWQAASGLDEGEISGVVETEFGFHVIRLEERRSVPFEDARDDVLEEFVDLPQALGRASDWVTTMQTQMQVDTQAILAWRSGDRQEGVLVRWPDSLSIRPYTGQDLLEYVEAFRPETLAAIQQVDSATTVGFVGHATRTYLMLERARQSGIEPTESQRMAIRQRWQDQVALWGNNLGFRIGMPQAEVKAQAIEALGAPEQSAALARSNLSKLSTRLRELYPVTVRTSGDS